MDWRELLDRALRGVGEAQRRLARVWETSGFAELAERLRRHPWFVPGTIGTALLLALVIAGVTSDEVLARSFRLVNLSAYDLSSAWLVLPFAFVVIAAMCVAHRDRVRFGRVAVVLLAALFFVRYDMNLATEGALPYLAIRETSDLFGYLLVGVGLWLYGRFYPAGGGLVFGLGLVAMLIARWRIGQSHSIFRPDLFPLLYSIPLAVSATVDARSNFKGPELRSAPEPRPGLHGMGLFAGGLIGGVLQHIEAYREGVESTTGALGSLWSQSVLTGHGHGPLMRLLRTATEPAVIAEPRWMGWTGFLASDGVLALFLLAVLSGVLVWREGRSRVEHRAAALGAQFTIGLMIFGGPNSMIPILLLVGWTALALSVPFADFRASAARAFNLRVQQISRWALAATLILLAVVCLRFRGPFVAGEILNEISTERTATEETTAKLERAEALNPWSPVPHLIRAAWRREELTRAPRWDESLYRSICESYERAMSLDPYESTIVLRLADVQSIAERSEEALATVETALERTPGAVDLIAWVYFHATTHNRPEVARRMVNRSLMLEPEAARWWRDRFRFERDAGRGPRARVALHVALTAAVNQPDEVGKELIRTTFLREENRP